MGGVAERKAELRAAARRAGGPPRDEDVRSCLEGLLALDPLAEAGCVALYSATGAEVPVQLAHASLRARGAEVAFPRVAGDRIELARIDRLEDLRPGFRGILEPPASLPALDPGRLGVLVVPGVLFGRDGSRLGRGGGHYDRLLARSRPDACRIGVCLAGRLRPTLPTDARDEPVDVIVTEREVLYPSARAAREGR